MSIDDKIRESINYVPNVNDGLKQKIISRIESSKLSKNVKYVKPIYLYRYIVTLSIVIVLTVILVLSIFLKQENYERFNDDVDFYDSLITRSDVNTDYQSNYSPISPNIAYKITDKYPGSLVLYEVLEDNNEYIGGYIKEDIVEFLEFAYSNNTIKHKHLDYDNVLTGNLISEHKSLSYKYELPKIISESKYQEDGTKITKTCTFTDDDIRWYKFNHINDVQKEMNGYVLNIVFSSRNVLVKEDLETNETKNIFIKNYFPVLYQFESNKLTLVTPREDDLYWLTNNWDKPGEYIQYLITDYYNSLKTSLYTIYIITEKNDKKYFTYEKNIGDENIMFSPYTLYFYDAFNYDLTYNSNDIYRYYDYDKVIKLFNDIYEGKLERYNKYTSPWPKDDFFHLFGLTNFNKPTGGIYLRYSPYEYLNQISSYITLIIDKVDKEYFDLLTRSMYDQGYQYYNYFIPYATTYDNLLRSDEYELYFAAKKKFDNKYILVSIKFVIKDNNIIIKFQDNIEL